MKKDTLIDLYWILDAVQKGTVPNLRHASECFISIRDELMQPDTEDIVDHIREALVQTQATADVLTHQLIGKSRRAALADERLIELMNEAIASPEGQAALSGGADEAALRELLAGFALRFGRLVEAAHGIKSP